MSYSTVVIFFRECDIDFYYAISPGLDITYSNAKEIACLKRKLDQVGIFTDLTAFIWTSCTFNPVYLSIYSFG